MAGSYNHVITEEGNLRGPEKVSQTLETGGDVYEAVEEMYGMIWWLAHMAPDAPPMTPAELVQMACQNYPAGLELAKQNKNKRKHRYER